MSIQDKLLAGAMAGLMAGTLVACGGNEAAAPAAEAPAAEAPAAEKAPAEVAEKDQPKQYTGNSCAGTNVCKGLGGCKVAGQNECKGKNPCKGKGGCHITGEEQAKFAAAMAKGEEPQPAGGADHSCKGENGCNGEKKAEGEHEG